MKNAIRLLLAALTIAVAFAAGMYYHVQKMTTADDEPSLADTVAWIQNTYNSHEGKGGAWGHGREEWASDGKAFRRRLESLKFDGCKLTLTVKDDPSVPQAMLSTFLKSVELKDVDPNSIEFTTYDSQHGGLKCAEFPNLTCDMAELNFETYNQRPSMSEELTSIFPNLVGKDRVARMHNTTFVATILLDDVKYGNRFVKAFRHAIELCGGKVSPF